MKALKLIDELEKLIENGSSLPFSAKALINPEEALEILEELKESLPREFTEAKEIVGQKNQILVEAQNEADSLRQDAERHLAEMIDTNEITRNATEQAERIMESAKNSAKSIRVGTQHYADKVLYRLQCTLKELNDQIEADRGELRDFK